MSSTQRRQQPQILGKEEYKTESKFLKLESITWKDQEGKEVSPVALKLLLWLSTLRTSCSMDQ